MSRAEYQPTSLFLAEEQPLLDTVETAAAEIQVINDEAAGFEPKAPEDNWRRRGLGRLILDQTKAFTQMLAASEQIDYDEFMQRTERTARWQDRLASERTALEQEYTAQAESIRKKATYYMSVLPRATDDFVDEANEQIAQIDRQPLERVGYQERAAERVAAKLGKALRIAGWLPIPTYISVEQRRAIYESIKAPAEAAEPEEQTPETIEVDRFPVDPATLTKAELVERVQKKYPESRRTDASAFLALILAEDPGRAYTYRDLGQMIYPNQDTEKASMRVTALIGNLRNGTVQVIPKTLAEQHDPPLMLQVGERVRYYKETGVRVGQRLIVYRAVANPGEPARSLYEDDKTDINWRTVEASTAPDDSSAQKSLL